MATKLFYCKNLENVVLNMYKHLPNPDKLLIISGYLGPVPLNKLQGLPFKSEVIGGMYFEGINSTLFQTLTKIVNNNSKSSLKFSEIPIHSKMYIWEKNNQIIKVLMGSANFSSSGLTKDMKETLASITPQAYPDILKYINTIRPSFTTHPKLSTPKHYVMHYNTPLIKQYDYLTKHNIQITNKNVIASYEFPLFSTSRKKSYYGKVPAKSGLNWGRAKAHTKPGDAYIAIPSYMFTPNQKLIKPFNSNYKNEYSNKKRMSEPIDMIWDDGTIMQMSFEGEQKNNLYPKQLTSFSTSIPHDENGNKISAKSILGRYLRKRIGVSLNHKITIDDLKNYGRKTITISALQNGIYYADFSPKH